MNLKLIKKIIALFLCSFFVTNNSLYADWAGTWRNFDRHVQNFFRNNLFIISAGEFSIGEHGIIGKIVNEKYTSGDGILAAQKAAGEWRYFEQAAALMFSQKLKNIDRKKYHENVMHYGGGDVSDVSANFDVNLFFNKVFSKIIATNTSNKIPTADNVPNSSDAATLTAAGFVAINNPQPAAYVEILDEKNLVFATRVGNGQPTSIDTDAMQNSIPYFSSIWNENLLFSWKDAEFSQINQRAVDFRHGLKLYCGHILKTFFSNEGFSRVFYHNMRAADSKIMFSYGGENGGKNPFNPFDPAEPWAVVTNIPAKAKHVCLSGNSDIWVYGADAQPYVVNNDAKKAPYLLKYRDACSDLAVGTNKAAIIYDNKIKIKDIANAKNWKPDFDAITQTSAWRSRYDVALYQEPGTRWSDVTAQAATQNTITYNSAPFLDGAGEVAFTGTFQQIRMGKDDILWILTENKILKDGSVDFTPAGVTTIQDFSVGLSYKDSVVALDHTNTLYILVDDENKIWRKTNLVVQRASVGKDGSIAIIDGAGKIWIAKGAAAGTIASPLAKMQGKVNAQIKIGDSTFLKANGTKPVSGTTGDTFEIIKHGDIISIKGKEGYLTVTEGSVKFTKQPDLVPLTESGSGKLEKKTGQWVVIAADGNNKYFVDRMSGKYLTTNFTLDAAVVAACKFDITFANIGSEADFNLFMSAVKNITDSAFVAGETSTPLSELEIKLILCASACGIFVNEANSLEPSTTGAVTTFFVNQATGKTEAPDGLATEERATIIATELDELTKDKTNQDKISLKPGLANLLNKALLAINANFKSSKDLVNLIKKITGRFTSEKLGVGFNERITTLNNKFVEIKNNKNAEDFANLLENIALDRIDTKEDIKLVNEFIDLINKTSDQSLNASKAIQTAGLNDKIIAVKKRLTNTSVDHKEIIDRIERLVNSAGTLNTDQITLLNFFLDAMKTTTALCRLNVAKNRTLNLKDVINRAKALNSGVDLPFEIEELTFDDFKTNFLSKIDKLWFKRGGTTDSPLLDASTGLWKTDSPVDNNAKTVKAIDPAVYYSLQEFWKDFSAWKDWSPDLALPANKYPLIRICNQVKESIEKNFSEKTEYAKIKIEAAEMLSTLSQ